MKNIVDFVSGYISGVILTLFVFALTYLGQKHGINEGGLSAFLFGMIGLFIGSIISIVSFFVVLAKMNPWQRVGIFTFIVTTPLVIYMSQ